jgi:hypothetical protein
MAYSMPICNRNEVKTYELDDCEAKTLQSYVLDDIRATEQDIKDDKEELKRWIGWIGPRKSELHARTGANEKMLDRLNALFKKLGGRF